MGDGLDSVRDSEELDELEVEEGGELNVSTEQDEFGSNVGDGEEDEITSKVEYRDECVSKGSEEGKGVPRSLDGGKWLSMMEEWGEWLEIGEGNK